MWGSFPFGGEFGRMGEDLYGNELSDMRFLIFFKNKEFLESLFKKEAKQNLS